MRADPRIARLRTIGKEGSAEEKAKFLALILEEVSKHKLGAEYREAQGKPYSTELCIISALPLVVADLDARGEQLPFLLDLARLYVETDYGRTVKGDPLADGNGISTLVSTALGMGVELVLKHRLQAAVDQGTPLGPALDEYAASLQTFRRSGKRADVVKNLGKPPKKVPTYRLAERTDPRGLAHYFTIVPDADFWPAWYKPGSLDWMVIAWGKRVLDESPVP